MGKDYLAALFAEPGDKEDSGVKGMKWGVRRTSAQLRAAAATRKGSTPAKKTESSTSSSSSSKKSTSDDPPAAETSSQRYARLAQVAKDGGASSLPDADLKFFNARTEAISKINKLNETKPGWLADTSKKVLQQTAQNQMQSIADGVAKKYISGPVLDGLTKKTS